MINTVIWRGCDSTLRAGALLTPFVMSSVSHPATDIPCAHLWVSHTCSGIYTGGMVGFGGQVGVGGGVVGRRSHPVIDIPCAHFWVFHACQGIYTVGVVAVVGMEGQGRDGEEVASHHRLSLCPFVGLL